MTMVIVMMINDHADGEDHDKTPLMFMFMAVVIMINDHAFSLHLPSDVNRGAAAYSWVNR